MLNNLHNLDIAFKVCLKKTEYEKSSYFSCTPRFEDKLKWMQLEYKLGKKTVPIPGTPILVFELEKTAYDFMMMLSDHNRYRQFALFRGVAEFADGERVNLRTFDSLEHIHTKDNGQALSNYFLGGWKMFDKASRFWPPVGTLSCATFMPTTLVRDIYREIRGGLGNYDVLKENIYNE